MNCTCESSIGLCSFCADEYKKEARVSCLEDRICELEATVKKLAEDIENLRKS